VQETVGIAASAMSFALAFPAGVTQGDQVTVFAACAGHSNQLAVSGLSGSVWNLIENNPLPLDPASPADALWQTAAPAGAGNSITITATSADECAAYAAEWSGTSGVRIRALPTTATRTGLAVSETPRRSTLTAS
jgi:hypothetical protein